MNSINKEIINELKEYQNLGIIEKAYCHKNIDLEERLDYSGAEILVEMGKDFKKLLLNKKYTNRLDSMKIESIQNLCIIEMCLELGNKIDSFDCDGFSLEPLSSRNYMRFNKLDYFNLLGEV